MNWFTKNTMISTQEINERYREFVKTHPLGKIGKTEYLNLLRECYGKDVNYKGLETYIFETYDRNGDGWVDFSEFLKVLYILSNASPKEKFKYLLYITKYHQPNYLIIDYTFQTTQTMLIRRHWQNKHLKKWI